MLVSVLKQFSGTNEQKKHVVKNVFYMKDHVHASEFTNFVEEDKTLYFT